MNIRRVERAKLMLAETRLTVGDIALDCGFNGVSQFGRSFRDVVGQTPLEFRRRS
ncbi:helix-turn-helix domain-containing protein [Agrobacterium sp. CG674]